MSEYLTINQFSPHIFEHDYVTGVLGINVPLNESTPYSNELRQEIIKEQLLLEGFFDGFKQLAGDMKTAGLAMRYAMEDASRIKIFVNEVMKIVDKKYNKLVEWMKSILDIGKNILSKFKPAEILVTFIEKIKGAVVATYEKVKSIDGWKKVLFALTAAVGVKFVWDKLEDAELLDFDLIEKIKAGLSESHYSELSLVSSLYGKDFLLKEESEDVPGMSSKGSSALRTLIDKVKGAAKSIGADFVKGLAVDAIAGAVSGGIVPLFKFLSKIFGGIKVVWDVVADPIKAFVKKIENPEEEKKEAEAGKGDPTVKESYIRNRLKELVSESITVIPTGKYYFEYKSHPESVEEQAKDLAMVVAQHSNRRISARLQHVCDENFEKLFQIFLESKGRTYNIEYYNMLLDSMKPMIEKLKEYYDRPRPSELAKTMGIKFVGDDLETVSSPSYPSGHTIQAYVLAHMLSDQFSEHQEKLLAIAEVIAQSRIDRGVHFPTDIEYGRAIARSLYEQIKKNLGGETLEFKVIPTANAR